MSTQPLTDSPTAKKHAGLLTVIIVIVAIALTLGAWFYFSAPSPKQFQPIVDSLTSGNLKSAKTGTISTERPYPGLFPRDEMFVVRRPDGTFLALFPTYRNKGTDIAGLLYTSRPLVESDTYPMPSGLNIKKETNRRGQHSTPVHRQPDRPALVSRLVRIGMKL